MRAALESRGFIAAVVACAVGLALFYAYPLADDPVLGLIGEHKPTIYSLIRGAYMALLFSTPFLLTLSVLSAVYVYWGGGSGRPGSAALPAYVPPEQRQQLYLTVGEVWHPRRREKTGDPFWLDIHERGLYTGTAIIGAVGSGKTAGCMYPFAQQILSWRAEDATMRASALVLEVKGDFCAKVHRMLKECGREADYVEISLDSKWRYNPLHNDLDAYALAYGIASLLNNLFGKSKDPFWQMAYTNLVKFIILLYRTVNGYVTLFDVYHATINPDVLKAQVERGARMFAGTWLLVTATRYLQHPELDRWRFEQWQGVDMRAAYDPDLEALLVANAIEFDLLSDTQQSVGDTRRRAEFDAVARWYYGDWMRIEPKLRTSIVEGISVFLSLFDDNPDMKTVFCPPRECYDQVKNMDGRHGRALPPFSELIEQGKVVALNFPVSANPGLARAVGAMMKQDWQRAMIGRIPRIEAAPASPWRPALFLCDEYQSFATCGEEDPSGDDKFFALSRQSKCIAIVATQSISSLRSTLPGNSSWETLLQTFRTKIFLTSSDNFTAKTASELCGKEEQFKTSYALWESGQNAHIDIAGNAAAKNSSMGANKTYALQRDFIFEPKAFTELRNMEAIVLAFTGDNPLPPMRCYLKPYFADVRQTYWEQIEKGVL